MPDTRYEIRVRGAVIAIIGLMCLGTTGYRAIEGWPWFDCFYMTTITLATIGYSEPQGISDMGRYFTAALIILGVGTVGYSVSVLTHLAIQGELLARWEGRRVQERIGKIKDHYIICGIGRVGLRVAQGLAAEGIEFVVVERERAKVEAITDRDWLLVLGDATREEVLMRAGIERAQGLVAALPTDADNVFIVLTARDMSDRLTIVARVNDERAIPKMRKAGADKVISPLQTGAHQILQALLRPTVAQFIELATMTEGLDLVIEELHVEPDSVLDGRKLRDTDIRRELNVIVVAILRDKGEMIFNPGADTMVRGGDKIIAIGNNAGVDGLAKMSQGNASKVS
jgi:voltage-gated potassium channel